MHLKKKEKSFKQLKPKTKPESAPSYKPVDSKALINYIKGVGDAEMLNKLLPIIESVSKEAIEGAKLQDNLCDAIRTYRNHPKGAKETLYDIIKLLGEVPNFEKEVDEFVEGLLKAMNRFDLNEMVERTVRLDVSSESASKFVNKFITNTWSRNNFTLQDKEQWVKWVGIKAAVKADKAESTLLYEMAMQQIHDVGLYNMLKSH